MKLDEYHVLDLAGYICGLDEDDYPMKLVNSNNPEDEGDSETVEFEQAVDDTLRDKFDIDLTTFSKLMTKLLPMVDVGVSPITQNTFKGFSAVDKSGVRRFFLKMYYELA